MRHDIKLIDLLLNLGANPILRSADKYGETALDKCEWRWKLFLEQRRKQDDDEKEHNFMDLNDMKEAIHSIEGTQKNEHKPKENVVYIRSLYLSKILYIEKLGKRKFQNTWFVEAGFGLFDKMRAQFILQSIKTKKDCFCILIKFGSLSYKELESCNHFGDGLDLALTANISDKSVSFLPCKHLYSQHWFAERRVIGNDEGITFCVCTKTKQYQLIVTDDHQMKIKQISVADGMEQEGRNLDDSLQAMFVILHRLKKHSFVYAKNQYGTWSNWLNYKSALTGNIEKCQLIHQQVVDKLRNAMTIQKLHGNTHKDDDDEKKYSPPNRGHSRFKGNTVGKSTARTNYPPPGFSKSVQRVCGIVKTFDRSKGFGFIRLQNGEDVFVHHREIKVYGSLFQSLMKGERVEFEIVEQDGRKKATKVTGLNNSFVKGQRSVSMNDSDQKFNKWR